MASITWGLLCFTGILASGTLGNFPPPRSQQRHSHSARVSPKVSSTGTRQRFDVKSPEQTVDEVAGAESFQEVQQGEDTVRGSQQQRGRAGVDNHLTQGTWTTEGGGWCTHLSCTLKQLLTVSLFSTCLSFVMNPATVSLVFNDPLIGALAGCCSLRAVYLQSCNQAPDFT